MRKVIGKITHAHFGIGGYQDAMIGFSVTLWSDKESWSVGDFNGTWAERTSGCKWTVADQSKFFARCVRFVLQTLTDAKKSSVDGLVGTPVEVTFDGNTLKTWRVLTEAI